MSEFDKAMRQIIGFDLEVQAYHYDDMRKIWNAALEAELTKLEESQKQRIAELQKQLAEARAAIEAYQKCVNSIDDYFEYRMESKADQGAVHTALTILTAKLRALEKTDDNP